MDTLQAIHSRRSIRSYSDRAVTREQLDILLRAAMAAPSAGNSQSWRFVVLTDKERLAKTAELSPYMKMGTQAAAGILVCGDSAAERHLGFWVQECSAAIQNILLAVADMGLGAVWTGIYPVQATMTGFREYFALPETVTPLGLVYIGYPAQTEEQTLYATAKDRFDRDKIHYNTW